MFINNEYCEPYKYNKDYYITKTGKIYSIKVLGKHGETDLTNPHLLSYSKDKDGYYRVTLSNNGKLQYERVHKIVVEQFIGDIPNGYVINHLDGNKQNNNVENLEITTVKKNTQHAHKFGLVKRDIKVKVIFNNRDYYFNSMKDCISYFPDLSIHYLNQLKRGIILYSMVLFKKQNSNRISPIDAYYNGQLYKTFPNMKKADIFFNKRIGTTSSTFKNNTYRNKINKYIITFPNVSTIESTQLSGSK